MAIKIEKSFQVPEPADQVWKVISDPRSVGSCVPGARITEAVDEKTYKGVIKIKLGASVTEVATISELNVIGILAQMGSRMIQEVANQIFEEFTKNLRLQLASKVSENAADQPPAETKPIDAGSLAVSASIRAIGRIFKGDSKE